MLGGFYKNSMENKSEKNKYVIYNEDGKVLVFTSKSGREYYDIYIPTVIVTGLADVNDKFNADILNLLVEQQNLCYLKQSIHTQNIYTTINRKLKSQTLQTLRNYYSCYKEFSKQDYEDIIKLCYKNNVLPHFLTIDELKQLIISYNGPSSGYKIDISMNESLDELQKRLSLKKY